MASRVPATLAKQFLRIRSAKSPDIPQGCLAVYLGEIEKKIFVMPVSYLSQPSFQDFLRKAEDEYDFHHPMGDLTIPCPV